MRTVLLGVIALLTLILLNIAALVYSYIFDSSFQESLLYVTAGAVATVSARQIVDHPREGGSTGEK